MVTPLRRSKLALLETYTIESILADWHAAMTNFHRCYYQLVTCVNERSTEQELTLKNIVSVDKRPVNLLIKLINAMKEELKRLTKDMDDSDQFSHLVINQNYEKLLVHTQILNQLNQQARHQLCLVVLPSS